VQKVEPDPDGYDALRSHVGRRISITDAEFDRLKSYFRSRPLRKKETLVRAGEISSEQAYIVSGCMRSFLD
jgi:CRP/FNR family transcriptional regulator, anaerobic regulatory protein